MALSYYDILGIESDAQESEIRRAYRRVRKKYHPDLHPNDEKSARRSRELNLALETLLDPRKRERYDRLLERRQLCRSGRETDVVIRAAMVGAVREIQLQVRGRDLGTFQYRPTDLQPQGEISDMASTSVYIATRDAQFTIEAFDYVH